MISPTFTVRLSKIFWQNAEQRQKRAVDKGISFVACDKSLVPTQISVNSLNMDKTLTTFIVVTDLTQHMEEELKSYTADLEKIVEQRTEKLALSNQKLSEILDGMQEGFYIS